jgi:hypothetical protein
MGKNNLIKLFFSLVEKSWMRRNKRMIDKKKAKKRNIFLDF